MKFISWAPNFEDVMLWRALRHVRSGFWVDVGAVDPNLHSVTRAFSERGWRGINTAPTIRSFRSLQAARPNDINLNVAIGELSEESKLHAMRDENGSTGTASLFAATEADNRQPATTVVAPTDTLTEICTSYVTGPIHFLKIDAGGRERAALAGADFVRFRPWILLVSSIAPGADTQTHPEWEARLVDADYHHVYFDGLNRFYIAAENSADLLPHFQAPPNVFDNFVRGAEVAAWEGGAGARRAAAGSAEAHAKFGDRAATRKSETEIALLAMEARAIAAENQVLALTSSTSWRLTRPVRGVAIRGRRLLSHPRLRLLRTFARRLLGRPDAMKPQNRVQDSAATPEWQLASFRLLDDEGVMAVRAHFALAPSRSRRGSVDSL